MAKVTGTKGKSTVKKITETRKTSIPPKTIVTTSSSRTVTQEQIARRAYEIYASGNGGSPVDNWLRAERELRGGK